MSLSNLYGYSGSVTLNTLDIKNIDCVSITADEAIFKSISLNGTDIATYFTSAEADIDGLTTSVTNLQTKTQYQSAADNTTTFNGGLVATGICSAASYYGTLMTTSQPNITSVGSLSSLDVGGNLTSNTATFTSSTSTVAYVGTLAVSSSMAAPSATITSFTSSTAHVGTLAISSSMTTPSATITSFTSTNAYVGTLAISSSLSAPSATFTSFTSSSGYVGSLVSPSFTSTNSYVGTLAVSSSLAAPSATITSFTSSNAYVGTLAISSSLSAPSATITSFTSTNSYVGTLAVSSSVSVGGLVSLSNDLFVGTGRSVWIGNGNSDSASQKLRLHQSNTSAFIDVTGNSTLNFRIGTSPSVYAYISTSGLSVTGVVSASSGISVSSITNGNITHSANTKGSRALTNCNTFGSETANTTFGQFSASSNTSQTGYTLSASSSNTTAYRAFGTYSGNWNSQLNVYNTSGAYIGANSMLIDGITISGEYVQCDFSALGYSVVPVSFNVSFYKDANCGSVKSIIIAGYTSAGYWTRLVTYDVLTDAGQSIVAYPSTNYTAITKYAVLFNTIYSSASLGYIQAYGIYMTGFSRKPSQELYVPQCLEVGRPYNVDTSLASYSVVCNGNMYVNEGDLYSNGFFRMRNVCCRVTIENVAATSNSIFAGTTLTVVDIKPPEAGGSNSLGTNGIYGFCTSSYATSAWRGVYRAPVAGLYRVSVIGRFSDTTANCGLYPYLTTNGTSYTNCLPNDNIVFAYSDGSSNRRFVMYNDLHSMTVGQGFLCATYGTQTLSYAVMVVELVSAII